MLLLTNIANAQVQNEVNLLPDTGNVGIGTANPVEKLDVKGNARLDGNLLVDSVHVNDNIHVSGNINAQKDLFVNDTLRVGKKLRVDASMIVSDALQVDGTFSTSRIEDVEKIFSDTLVIKRIISPDSLIYFGDSSLVVDVDYNRIYEKEGKGISLLSPSSSANGMYSLASGYFSIVGKNGNYGLAMGYRTRALAEKTFVIGTGNNTWFSSDIPNSLSVGFNTNYPSLFVGPTADGMITGNVGVSTNNSTDKLVIGNGYEQFSFGSAVNQDAGWLISYMGMNATRTRTSTWQPSVWTISGDASSGYGGGIIATDAGGKMFIIPVATGANTTTTLTDAEIYARRVVEIGARSSSSGTLGAGLMRVNGNIICQDLEVTLTNWWDEVFSPGYSLMTISELQKYIDENGHLPGVPAESEVVGQTMSVQEMNLMLLKKVEELSLYVIELQKQIDELKKGGE